MTTDSRPRMPEPRYTDRWPGLGRVVALTFGNRVPVWVCSSCACTVIDTDRHTEWHRLVEARMR